VQLALKNYPAMAESRARAEAAEAAVDVAKTAYLPRLDAVWQENRATANNVYGILLPQSIIPSLTGPVLGTHSYDGVWSSAGGVLLSDDVNSTEAFGRFAAQEGREPVRLARGMALLQK